MPSPKPSPSTREIAQSTVANVQMQHQVAELVREAKELMQQAAEVIRSAQQELK